MTTSNVLYTKCAQTPDPANCEGLDLNDHYRQGENISPMNFKKEPHIGFKLCNYDNEYFRTIRHTIRMKM